MKPENTSSWLAAYLYYNEPWERLLTEALLPYAEIVLSTGIANSFFFVRYWEKGPHIRLRFKADPEVIEKILRSNLEEHFLNYFESVPSFRTEPPYPAQLPDTYKWHPNNSVQYAPYVPETDRYGGPAGIVLAEQQFALSSKTVLQYILSKGQHWSYDDALGVAIKLHLSFAHTTGMDRVEAHRFFTFFFDNWLPHSMAGLPNLQHKLDFQKQLNATRESFDKAFDIQKESLIQFHKTLWTGLSSNRTFEEEALNLWIAKNKEIARQLTAAERENRLKQRTASHRYNNKATTGELPPLWGHYADYIHLTNNRLGIHNKDEGYLAYLMMRSIEALEQSDDEEDEPGNSPTLPDHHYFISVE